MIRALLAASVLGLSACASGGGPDPQPPPAGRIVPAGDGFSIEGTTLQIGFGRAMEGAISAATRAQGEPPQTVSNLAQCVRVTWPDGLSMDFVKGAFRGWTDPQERAGALQGGEPCA